ncbi:MAG: ATP-binding cassette domain-containing protein, partial [Clostridiales bacterium]|nr:ATP-binding cassette domain-containing protein [Clostridiales bacterium]
MIQVRHLEKSFDGFWALRGVDMHVKKGAIYGLVGPNGAGKSTLIRHITGAYIPDAGEVLI